uniref:Uncharacterized protein n=1 Tax=uncultured prokaryote TaxID=198431 RepID=A0A0H5QLI7_9ZZZZ|nr:hypothetical protein [uncultured prokaryote]
MVSRTITAVDINVRQFGREWLVQVTTTYCESDIGGGRIAEDVARYERLSLTELRQVLEDVSYGSMPGLDYAEEGTLVFN